MLYRHNYGYVPDKKDDRDYKYFSVRETEEALPKEIDLRHLVSPVRDQGNLGSCTAFAIASGYREFMQKEMNQEVIELSPLYLYYKERAYELNVGYDSGATIRTGMKVLNQIGCCTEELSPYIEANFKKRPTCKMNRNAKQFKITSYRRLITLFEMKDCLADGHGFVFGFMVFPSFESSFVENTGIVPMPAPNEETLGGHAVFAVGYKDDTMYDGGGYFIVKNSWGSEWGDNGYFYLPYGYVNHGFVVDAWTGEV